MQFLIEKLLLLARDRKNHSRGTIIFANILSFFAYLVFLPAFLVWLAILSSKHIGDFRFAHTYYIINLLLMCTGIIIRTWASIVHYKIGRGSPLYSVPTKRLVVEGPYKYSRNPIMLGIMLYYLGFALLFGSFAILLIVFIVPSILGNLYHKLIEEKELFMRFGNEYLAYKNSVPFLFPSLKKKS